MNERIKQLAEQQAGSILMDLVMPDAGMPERIKWNIGCTTEHLEKFAELLVHECASIVENLAPGYDDYRNQIEDAFRRDAISEMKYILLGEENES